MNKDQIFDSNEHPLGSFKFDHKVAQVFDDMVSRSVPGYADQLILQSKLAMRFTRPDSVVVDIGCSTGNSLFPLFKVAPTAQFIGIDPSLEMLQRFEEKLQFLSKRPSVELVNQSIQDFSIPGCDIVFLNYTLQFIAPQSRLEILKNIYDSLNPGGVLFFSEKMQNMGSTISNLEVDFYYDYKRQNGYSELEISQKRDALEKVLIPDSLTTHLTRLDEAGFKEVGLWHKWFNFGSFLAIKKV